ncbi:hypothetical protein MA13_contig00012-0076 [Edwardsiella piscicida]|nr:hypothetical protein MA13_contig00012-0076 [Edwardsiella piscicida]
MAVFYNTMFIMVIVTIPRPVAAAGRDGDEEGRPGQGAGGALSPSTISWGHPREQDSTRPRTP